MRWRYCCPKGHHNIRRRTRKGGYYCQGCAEGYAQSEIFDKMAGGVA